MFNVKRLSLKEFADMIKLNENKDKVLEIEIYADGVIRGRLLGDVLIYPIDDISIRFDIVSRVTSDFISVRFNVDTIVLENTLNQLGSVFNYEIKDIVRNKITYFTFKS